MNNIIMYEAVSRVVKDNKVIGFMVRPKDKKKEQVFMSLDVLSFGLSQRTFEIKDVKLGNNGKPRGCNGFLLSKLPLVSLEEEDNVKAKLIQVLNYLAPILGIELESVNFYKSGAILNCLMNDYLVDYKDMEAEIANFELSKTLKFYDKTMPKELKSLYDRIEGKVDKRGLSTIVICKSLVKDGMWGYEKIKGISKCKKTIY